MIFAAAFDRILPERAAQVSENRGVPVTALLFIMVPAIIVSASSTRSPRISAR